MFLFQSVYWLHSRERNRHFLLESGSEWIKTKSFLPTGYKLRAADQIFKYWIEIYHFCWCCFGVSGEWWILEPIILGIWYLIQVWMKSVFLSIFNGILDQIQYTNLQWLLHAQCTRILHTTYAKQINNVTEYSNINWLKWMK